ncbi:hypothetical protein SNEBB_010469 [Seison nebaliae]|nr:hypothetical protein SNEBB_010469 [Seison nebaliae]
MQEVHNDRSISVPIVHLTRELHELKIHFEYYAYLQYIFMLILAVTIVIGTLFYVITTTISYQRSCRLGKLDHTSQFSD